MRKFIIRSVVVTGIAALAAAVICRFKTSRG